MLNIILILQLLSVPSLSQDHSCVSLFQQSQVELSDEVTDGLYKLAEDQVRTQKLPMSEFKNMILREIKRQVFEKANEFDSPEVVFSTYRKAVAELSALLKDSVDIINARNLQIREKQRLINEFILKQKKVEEIKKKYNIEEIEHIVPIAADRGEVADIKFLISLGIDLNYKVRDNSALELSAKKGNYEVMDLLLEAGAYPYETRLLEIIVDRYRSPEEILRNAAAEGNFFAVKVLLRLNVSPLLDGQSSAYLEAVNSNRRDIAKLILDHEIQYLARDNNIDISLATHAKQIQSAYKVRSLESALGAAIKNKNMEEIKILFQSMLTFEENHIELIYKSSIKNEILRNLAVLQMKEKGIHTGYVSAVTKILSKYKVISLRAAMKAAIKSNNKNDIVILLRTGVDKNVILENGQTLVTYAALIGNFKLMDYLIELGVDANATDSNEETVNDHVVRIIGNKINYDIRSTVLIKAVEKGHYEYVERLIKAGKNIDGRAAGNYDNINGATPLMVAYMYGKEDIANLLIRHGADVKAKDSKGLSVDDYRIRWLIKKYETSHLDEMAFKVILKDSMEDLKFLVKYNAGRKFILKFDEGGPYYNHSKILKSSNYNSHGIYDANGYHSTFEFNNLGLEIVKIKLKEFSMSLLEYATYRENYSVVKYLIEAGLPIDRTDNQITPLMLAAQSGKLGIVKLLVESGSNLFEARDFLVGNTSGERTLRKVEGMRAVDFASTKEIRNYLKAEMKKQRPGFFQRLFNRSPK